MSATLAVVWRFFWAPMRPEPPLRAIVVAAPPLGGAPPLSWALAQALGWQALPELALFLAEDLDGLRLQAQRSQSALGQGLLRALAMALHGGDSVEAVDLAQAWLWRRGEDGPAVVLDSLHQRLGGLVWADRHIGWRPDYLKRAAAMPGLLLLHLVRDPVQHGAVLQRHFERGAFVPPLFRDHGLEPAGRPEPQIGWYQFHRSVLQAQNAFGLRYQRLRYEDFVADPVGSLQRLRTLLDLPPGSPKAALPLQGPANAPGGWEAVEFDPQSLKNQAADRRWQPARGWAEESRVLARQLGYAL